MKKYFILLALLVGSGAYADCAPQLNNLENAKKKDHTVHMFKSKKGNEILLTNTAPVIASNTSNPTSKDLKLGGCITEDFAYVSSSKSIDTKEKVTTKPTQVYKLKMCQSGDVLVPCYQYAKTLPSQTYTVDSTKSVPVSSASVLKEAIAAQQSEPSEPGAIQVVE